MRTWVMERVFVGAVLLGMVWVTSGGPLEIIGAGAVLAGFAHAQVADRLAEREAQRARPDVHCHALAARYFAIKELLWLTYFVVHRSWSALTGVAVFLAYPLWRAWWRSRYPVGRAGA